MASGNEIINEEKNKKVVILATGGTIAGIGERGKSVRYEPGSLSVSELVSAIPEIKDVAEIEAIQICNVNSDDMTDEIWFSLANAINEMAIEEDISGFVVTHGTDTLEETAYFLNLTVKTNKPVVITGSMRPASSFSADGPMNLYESVCVAASKEAKGHGVLVVFSDRIFSARSVTKKSTYRVDAISGSSIGMIRDGKVHLYETPTRIHTFKTEFDVSELRSLPKIAILYYHIGADENLLKYVSNQVDGIVIAGAGAGEFSEKFKNVIKKLNIPVVISSRIDGGIILTDNLLCDNTIASDNLSPQKAAILLKLALTKTNDKEDIQEMFFTY